MVYSDIIAEQNYTKPYLNKTIVTKMISKKTSLSKQSPKGTVRK